MNYTIPTQKHIINMPPNSIQTAELWIPQGISYSFVVVEYIDSNNKVVKSRLETQRNIHDQYGNIQYSDPWFEVPRIQRPI